MRYKVPTFSFKREENIHIPHIADLWDKIDELQHKIDVAQGKEIDPSIPSYTKTQLYNMRHYLHELRNDQYLLRDFTNPTLCTNKSNALSPLVQYENDGIMWESSDLTDYKILPLGLYTPFTYERFTTPRTIKERDCTAAILTHRYDTSNNYPPHIIDFRNPNHILALNSIYFDLVAAQEGDPNCIEGDIARTLRFYEKLAQLTEKEKIIFYGKRYGKKAEQIIDIVEKKCGVRHMQNYISTLYHEKICGKIAAAAKTHFDEYWERENTSMWKKCCRCGEYKLRDTRFWTRKKGTSDGLNYNCKECDKKKRQSAKEKKK